MRLGAFADLTRASQPVIWLGLLGIALSGVCIILAVARGLLIPPEGDLSKAITFDAAVGLFALTLAVIVPLAYFGAVGWRVWLATLTFSALYGYAMETIETVRGYDPRFSRVATGADHIGQNLFFLVAIGFIGIFIVLAVKLWRKPTRGADGLVLLALRYAIGATMIAFAAGIWMSVIHGRYTGADGNILPLHAFGFHSLQAIPITGWLFSRSSIAEPIARRWVHAAGVAWIAACGGLVWQTAAGSSVLEASPAMLGVCAVLFVWLLSAVRALQAWRVYPLPVERSA